MGTSSAAVAAVLGYPDGEKMPFEALYALAKRLVAALSVPLSVDLEGGYSRTAAGICRHIEQLADIGVAGVNLEDSVVNSGRSLGVMETFAATVGAIKSRLIRNRVNVFLNVRTDAFLLEHPAPLAETLRRLKAYEAAGADGIFAPGLVERQAVQRVTSATQLPVNLLAMPALPPFGELGALGVRRISMGDFVHQAQLRQLERHARIIQQEQSFNCLF
ncbi:MAG: isocitrate lyase/phosphoenolpyruvate mutase family protein [Hymenobacter sp.]|nr:isocitrate lyase/phosphoenolpyruvate mutase family protein [Hymenobacter sp.]